MRFLLLGLQWFVYFPLVKILGLVLVAHPKVRQRLLFERKNDFRPAIGEADFCFEFSSEGEFQQVASLIEDGLQAGKKIELVFFSPSVEKTIEELQSKYSQQLRILRYPLLTYSPWRSFSTWISARKLILVRYDLFPEFLIWSIHPQRELIMLWMTFKKERVHGKAISWLKKAFLQNARKIFYASAADQEQGVGMGLPGPQYDFRMEQIRRRMDKRLEKFESLFPLYSQFEKHLEAYPREKRVILGNAWPSDLFLLKDLPPDVLLVVVPHQLSSEILSAFNQGLEPLGRKVVEIGHSPQNLPASGTYLVNKKGILCELYADFGRAYVGGGFETSVHSLLEPLVAGADSLACGPLHHRSTEFDIALSLGKIRELQNPQDFIHWLEDVLSPQSGPEELSGIIRSYPQHRKEVISC